MSALCQIDITMTRGVTVMHLSDDTMRAIRDARISRIRGEQRIRSRLQTKPRYRNAR